MRLGFKDRCVLQNTNSESTTQEEDMEEVKDGVMDKPLSSSAQKVQQALAGFGLDCRVKELSASTRTADDAAQAVGCDVG